MEETVLKVDVWETPPLSKFHKLTTFVYQHEFLKRLIGRLIEHIVNNLPTTSPAIIVNIDKLIFETVQNFRYKNLCICVLFLFQILFAFTSCSSQICEHTTTQHNNTQ